jgi:hypothetical protein
MLQLSNKYKYSTGETLCSITYSPAKGIIAAGTEKGNIAMWKYMQHKMKFGEPLTSSQLMPAKSLIADLPVKSINVRIK